MERPSENQEALLVKDFPLSVTKSRSDVKTTNIQIDKDGLDNSQITVLKDLRFQNLEVSSNTDSNNKVLTKEIGETVNKVLSEICSVHSVVEENFETNHYCDEKPNRMSVKSEKLALGSLASYTVTAELTDRSDSSDSGLGTETVQECVNDAHSLDHAGLTKIECNFPIIDNVSKQYSQKVMSLPTRERQLKAYGKNALEYPIRSNLKRRNIEEIAVSSHKKTKKEIQFDYVTVYYFPRAQGFSCIPSQGGSTLGMDRKHSHVHTFTLNEHAAEQRRIHRQILHQIRCERQSLQKAVVSSSDESETEEEPSDISESELDLDNYYFLQPVTTRQRRVLLRNAGVKKIETSEKNECRDIRTSREFCGCSCKGFCDPETCPCSLSGIKCQVDRLNFPCGCSHDGCGNTTGRIEFNPVRVRTHFIHTLMRLGLEKKTESMMHSEGHWLEPVNSVTKPCRSFQIEQSHTLEDGLLRDVNLTPRVEVETCVNTGHFSNVHLDICNRTRQHFPQRDEQLDQHNMYSFHCNENYLENRTDQNVYNGNDQTTHLIPYASNLIPGKSPYAPPGLTYDDHTSNSTHNFLCDPNFSYLHQGESNQFNKLQSFSAASFDEFAQSAHLSMFSHYNQNMYMTDYLPKATVTIQEQPQAMQYDNVSSFTYNSYKHSTGAHIEGSADEYSLPNALCHTNNSLQSLPENEETQFMESVIVKSDSSHGTASTKQETQSAHTSEPAVTDSDLTENLGEIIKKTMVESVSV